MPHHDPHENYSSDWQTPREWVEWARETMGRIDCDPCASPNPWDNFAAIDNITADGLELPWCGAVYCNPPGSNSSESVRAWWEKAMRETRCAEPETRCGQPGTTMALVWCLFNCEHVRILRPSPLDLDGWLVIPSRRVAFVRGGDAIKSPRNWTWFWSNREPAPTPVLSWICRTGPHASNGVRHEATACN
jgi:hypothetical protein